MPHGVATVVSPSVVARRAATRATVAENSTTRVVAEGAHRLAAPGGHLSVELGVATAGVEVGGDVGGGVF